MTGEQIEKVERWGGVAKSGAIKMWTLPCQSDHPVPPLQAFYLFIFFPELVVGFLVGKQRVSVMEALHTITKIISHLEDK